MLVVLDTNILVSALISAFGTPARVLDLVLRGEIQVAYDDRLMAEYRDVLARPKFGFSSEDVVVVLVCLEADGERVIARPLPCKLPDPDDLPFLDVAAEVGGVLITGNTAHYPGTAPRAVQVVTPGEFIRSWQR